MFNLLSSFYLQIITYWFETQQLLLDNKSLIELLENNKNYFILLSQYYKEHLEKNQDHLFIKSKIYRYLYRRYSSLINYINTFFGLNNINDVWWAK